MCEAVMLFILKKICRKEEARHGKYFVMMFLDNPLIDIDYKDNPNLLTKKELIIWKVMTALGKLIDLYLIFFWGVPILYKIILC